MSTAAQELIAVDVESRADTAGINKAQADLSALGAAAVKAGDGVAASWQKSATAVNVQIGAFAEMGKTLDKTNLAAVASFRVLGTQLKETLGAMEAMDAELNRVDQIMLKVERDAGAAAIAMQETAAAGEAMALPTSRMQSAFVGAAFAVDAFTRSANSGEGATRRVLRAVSMLGFAFGPVWGIAVTSAVSALDALAEAFFRTETAARKAQDAFEKWLKTVSKQEERGFPELFEKRGEILTQLDLLEKQQAKYDGEIARYNTLTHQGRDATFQQALAYETAKSKSADLTASIAALKTQLIELTPAYEHAREQLVNVAQFGIDKKKLKEDMKSVTALPGVFTEQQLRDMHKALPALSQIGGVVDDALANRIERIKQLEFEQHSLNITTERSLAIEKELARLRKEVGEMERVPTKGRKVGAAPKIDLGAMSPDQMEEYFAQQDMLKKVPFAVATTVADAFAAGIKAGFAGEGVKGAFAAASKTLLSGFGGLMIDLGMQYIKYGAIMRAFSAFLADPLTAGWGSAAIGVAMVALGAALQGVASAHASGGSGGTGYNASFNPTQLAAGGGLTLIVQTVDPWSRSVVNNTVYEINRAGMLNTPVVAPYGRPS